MTLTKPPIGEVPITTPLAWKCKSDSVRRVYDHDGDDDTLFVVCDLRRGT